MIQKTNLLTTYRHGKIWYTILPPMAPTIDQSPAMKKSPSTSPRERGTNLRLSLIPPYFITDSFSVQPISTESQIQSILSLLKPTAYPSGWKGNHKNLVRKYIMAQDNAKPMDINSTPVQSVPCRFKIFCRRILNVSWGPAMIHHPFTPLV